MNYITQLNSFWKKAEGDVMLTPHHISLYMALFHRWNALVFPPTFTIRREEIMQAAKIGSKDTYYRCINELGKWGYLAYHGHPATGGLPAITMTPLLPPSTKSGIRDGLPPGVSQPDSGLPPNPVPGLPSPESGTGTVPNPGPFHETNKQFSNRAPSMEEVLSFFHEHKYDANEGKRFWYNYEGLGWQISGSQIFDWRALAHKWMFNRPKNSGSRPKNPPPYDDKPF